MLRTTLRSWFDFPFRNIGHNHHYSATMMQYLYVCMPLAIRLVLLLTPKNRNGPSPCLGRGRQTKTYHEPLSCREFDHKNFCITTVLIIEIENPVISFFTIALASDCVWHSLTQKSKDLKSMMSDQCSHLWNRPMISSFETETWKLCTPRNVASHSWLSNICKTCIVMLWNGRPAANYLAWWCWARMGL